MSRLAVYAEERCDDYLGIVGRQYDERQGYRLFESLFQRCIVRIAYRFDVRN